MYLSGLAFLPFLVNSIIRRRTLGTAVIAPNNNTAGIIAPIIEVTRHWPPSYKQPPAYHPPCHPPLRRRRGCCC